MSRQSISLFATLAVALPAAALELPIPDRPGRRPGAAAARESTKGKPIVAIFDFQSDYDHGRMGTFVAKNVWAKLDRSGTCVLIERVDVTEALEGADLKAAFDETARDLVAFAAKEFGATHVLWGQVEQIDKDGLVSERRLRIRVRAASAESVKDKDLARHLVVDLNHPVENQRTIQLATKEAVRLFLNIAKPAPEVGPEEERRWRTGPNLVKNGGFETGTAHPEFWEPLSNDPKHPQHRCVSWATAPGANGRCMKFVLPKSIAATYGAAYYSDPINIEDGELYRFSIRVRTDGPTPKIFLKHYKFFPPGPNEKKGQWRETRRAPLNPKGPKGQWQTHTRDFHPHRDDQHDPTVTRVELYAYWPKGTVYFDDVVLKKLKDRKAER
jgi:hypothetical protein